MQKAAGGSSAPVICATGFHRLGGEAARSCRQSRFGKRGDAGKFRQHGILLGVAKQHGTGQTKDANRIALRMPAICGELTKGDAVRVLGVSVREQQEVTASLPSLTKQRRDVLPNPGSLDKIVTDGEKRNLELIPRAKKQSNNLINLNITEDCGETGGPPVAPKEHEKPPPEVRIPMASAA